MKDPTLPLPNLSALTGKSVVADAPVERFVARVEAGASGTDTLRRSEPAGPKTTRLLYEDVYCQRGECCARSHARYLSDGANPPIISPSPPSTLRVEP
jgi:hypothetical protein